MLAGQQEVGRRLPTAEGRQRRAAGEAFSARRGRERGVKGAKKGQGGGQIGPGRRLGTWLKAACALARQGAGSLGVSAAGRARAGGGGRVCSSCQSLPEFRMFTNSQYLNRRGVVSLSLLKYLFSVSLNLDEKKGEGRRGECRLARKDPCER